MKKIEIVYADFARRELARGRMPPSLQRIASLPFCLQNMCLGGGQNWDAACPKWLRGTLDKEKVLAVWEQAVRLLVVINHGVLLESSATLRFFESVNSEKSFYEITANLNHTGNSMVGRISTLGQMYSFALTRANPSTS